MYYKEKWINGELHYTLSPKGSWKPFEKEDYIQRVQELEQQVNSVELDYWKQRCELAEKCIEESPCDPDITSDQIKAHNDYNEFISNFGNDHQT